MDKPARSLAAQWRDLRGLFIGLTIYEQFEHAIIIVLTILLIAVVASATWHLAIVVALVVFTNDMGPTDQAVFQSVFGMIFTVIIALEFRHSLIMVLSRHESVIRVRSIILIAMLAMVRKFIILDIAATNAAEVFALAAAILSLGIVYFMVREPDNQEPFSRR